MQLTQSFHCYFGFSWLSIRSLVSTNRPISCHSSGLLAVLLTLSVDQLSNRPHSSQNVCTPHLTDSPWIYGWEERCSPISFIGLILPSGSPGESCFQPDSLPLYAKIWKKIGREDLERDSRLFEWRNSCLRQGGRPRRSIPGVAFRDVAIQDGAEWS